MSGNDEHADGELEDVPAATDATPSVSTGNVSRLRKRDDSETSQCLLRKAPGWVPLKPPIPPVKLRVV